MEDVTNIAAKEQSRPLKMARRILFTVVAACVLGLVFIVFRMTSSTPVSPTAERVMAVATDPKFEELRGGWLPGVPELPAHPDATFVGSARTVPANDAREGYRVKWTVAISVAEAIAWYTDELTQAGWMVEVPNDSTSEAEQVANIKNAEFSGYIATEDEDGETEIIIDISTQEEPTL